ncbi:MAG: FtsX-like permease family protein, partial [Rhodospirillales bacterium]|nr:FtsX-like permease family protein [Rhodospirillales bacterium]
GVRPTDLTSRDILSGNITSGSLKNFKGNNAVLMGERLAVKLGLRTGNKITLISPKGNSTVFGTVPRMRAYRVVGTFKIGHSAYDAAYVFMPLKAAQIYFKLPGAVNHLDIEIDKADQTRDRMNAIFETLRSPIRIQPWQNKHSGFFTAIQVERNVMFMILTLIILVAAFNIVSSMIMLVKDKSTNIAVLRTMGATRGMILRIFFLSGSSVGVIGTLAGFLLGLLIAENMESVRLFFQWLTSTQLFSPEIYFLSQLPAIVETGEVISVLLMALALSFLATIYPSWRAARLDPVEVLRYE